VSAGEEEIDQTTLIQGSLALGNMASDAVSGRADAKIKIAEQIGPEAVSKVSWATRMMSKAVIPVGVAVEAISGYIGFKDARAKGDGEAAAAAVGQTAGGMSAVVAATIGVGALVGAGLSAPITVPLAIAGTVAAGIGLSLAGEVVAKKYLSNYFQDKFDQEKISEDSKSNNNNIENKTDAKLAGTEPGTEPGIDKVTTARFTPGSKLAAAPDVGTAFEQATQGSGQMPGVTKENGPKPGTIPSTGLNPVLGPG
jgi:hypothetical protein